MLMPISSLIFMLEFILGKVFYVCSLGIYSPLH